MTGFLFFPVLLSLSPLSLVHPSIHPPLAFSSQVLPHHEPSRNPKNCYREAPRSKNGWCGVGIVPCIPSLPNCRSNYCSNCGNQFGGGCRGLPFKLPRRQRNPRHLSVIVCDDAQAKKGGACPRTVEGATAAGT